MSIDLSKLPKPKVLEGLSFEVILEDMQAQFSSLWQSYSGEPHDPITKVLEVAALREYYLRQRVNEAAQAVMLPYAHSSDLDNIVSFFSITRLEGESDDQLRARAQLSMEGLSNAGTIGAYTYHTLTSDAGVKDCKVKHLNPGVVGVTVVSREGDGTATQSLLDSVAAHLERDDIKALCDTLVVASVEVVPISLTVHLSIKQGPDPQIVRDTVFNNLTRYIAKTKLGEGITASGIYHHSHEEGVFKATSSITTDQEITDSQALFLSSLTVTYEVINA